MGVLSPELVGLWLARAFNAHDVEAAAALCKSDESNSGMYAPDISNEDIGGGKLGGTGPFVIMPGHHGLMIQPRGQKETAAITEEYAEMLARLCKIKDVWCLPKQKQ
jgi:hypothetical protein